MEIAFFITLGLVAFAAAVDIFFLTGIWFSGLFLLATVGGLYTTRQIDILTTLPIVFVVTLATNCLNFYFGRSCSNVPLIQKQLTRPQV